MIKKVIRILIVLLIFSALSSISSYGIAKKVIPNKNVNENNKISKTDTVKIIIPGSFVEKDSTTTIQIYVNQKLINNNLATFEAFPINWTLQS